MHIRSERRKRMKNFCLVMAVLALLCMGGIAQSAVIQGSTSWNIFGNITTVNSHTFIMPQPTGSFSGMYVNPGLGDFSVVPDWVSPWDVKR
jgi:hypothetical protein